MKYIIFAVSTVFRGLFESDIAASRGMNVDRRRKHNSVGQIIRQQWNHRRLANFQEAQGSETTKEGREKQQMQRGQTLSSSV
jgi:hypothetical protein